MHRTLIFPAVIAAASLAAPAFAQGLADKPANCAVYAEALAETVVADPRVTGAAQSEAADSLGKYAALLRSRVEADIADTYATAEQFYGWDKATVDAKMKEGEAAIRAGFTGPTMEKGRVYTDHLLVIDACAKNDARNGLLGQADVDKLGGRLNAVLMAIR